MASKGLAALPWRRGSALARGCERSGRVVLPLARAAAVSTGLRVHAEVPGCNPMYPRLQPYVSQAAALCIPGLRDLGIETARGSADDEDREEDAVGYL